MLNIPETAAAEAQQEPQMEPPLASAVRPGNGAERKRERSYLLKQLVRFSLVGGLNTLIDILVLNVLLLLLPTSNTLLILACNALAYGAGAGNSFICNKYWTFRQHQRISRGELGRFVATTLCGMALNSAMLWLAGLALGFLQVNATLWTNAAKLLAISATMLVSYLGMRLWVFASKGHADMDTQDALDISRRATLPLHYVLQHGYSLSSASASPTGKDQRKQTRTPTEGHLHPFVESAEKIIPPSRHQDSTAQDVIREQGADFHGRYGLSLVLPAYNEEEVIANTVVAALHVLHSWHIDAEILVVNDGSSDHTGEIVAELARVYPQVHLINHASNQGYGAALVSGFQAASKELTFFMDSDGQFDIRALRSFFPFIEIYDAVLGYRINRQDSWMRKFNAWGWNILVRMALGVKVRDLDCAFKLFHTSFLREHPLETRGAMINAELLYKLKQGGFTQREIGVPHLPRLGGRATGAHPRVIARALRDLFIYTLRWKRAEKALNRAGSASSRQHV